MAVDPKEWRVREGEIDTLMFSTATEGIAVTESVARRRALSELKEMACMMCERCREGQTYVPSGTHSDEEGYSGLCYAEQVRDRIAEIEAEGA